MKRFTEENLKEAINKQFEISWHNVTYEDIKWAEQENDIMWFQKYTTTKGKEEEFIEWLKKYIKPYVSKHRLDKEVWHFILNYGLMVKK